MVNSTHDLPIIDTPIKELHYGAECISLEQLQHLVRLVDQSDIVELEVRHGDTKSRLVLHKSRLPVGAASSAECCSLTAEASSSRVEQQQYTITSPCVGLFQLWSKSKDNLPVAVGDMVQDGQHVGVIWSLGIPNEIESPVTGRIVEILVQNGLPIEYGQPLMTIEKQ